MTTNVFDRVAKMAATDSRWSLELPHAVVYVDDTGFEKIAHNDTLAFMFAGNSACIRDWKNWLLNPQSTVSGHPDPNGMALCIIELATSKVLFRLEQEIANDDSMFAGSGAWPAYTCWSRNKDALKAVESAKLADRYSGGTVKFLKLDSRDQNLNQPDDFDSIKNELLTRGMVMYFQNPPHVSVKEAAANDKVLAEALDKVANGQTSLTAPCPSAANAWSTDQLNSLDEVLRHYYPE